MRAQVQFALIDGYADLMTEATVERENLRDADLTIAADLFPQCRALLEELQWRRDVHEEAENRLGYHDDN